MTAGEPSFVSFAAVDACSDGPYPRTPVPSNGPAGNVICAPVKGRSSTLRLLADASVAFSEAALVPKQLVELIAQKLADAIGDNCVIWLIDSAGEWLRAEAYFTRITEQEPVFRKMFSEVPVRVGEGVTGGVAATGEPVLVSNVDVSRFAKEVKPEYRSVYEKYPSHSVMMIPLKARHRRLGVLSLSRQITPHPYSGDDLRLAHDLAERAGMALEISQLLERERAAAARATALAGASKAIQTLDLQEAVTAIVRAGADLIGDACVLTLIEDGVLRTKFAAHRDPAAEHHMKAVVEDPLPRDRGIFAQVLQENRALRLVNASTFQPALRSSEQFRKEFGIASLLVCPLRVEGRAIGTLGTSRGDVRAAYTSEDEAFLQELADRAAMVIHNARLYEAARAARSEAEKASAFKDEFLSAAGHELRTPLTTVQLTIQGMLALRRQEQKAPASDWFVSGLANADGEIQRLVHLVDDLLDVSRLAAGRLTFDPRQIDMCDLLRSVVGRFEGQAALARSPISVATPSSLLGSWDPARLDQVLTNLLTNAIKFGSGHPINVSMSDLEDRVRIAIADGGIGIPAKDQARIFERFERTQSARVYRGVGVGLWVVRQLLNGMGGSVRVESEPGRGATFIVEIPR